MYKKGEINVDRVQNKSKRKGIIMIMLAIVLAVTIIYSEFHRLTINKLISLFYEKDNFAFNVEDTDSNKGISAADGVWALTDLANYREVKDRSSNPAEWDTYTEFFRNEDGSLNWDNITDWAKSSDNEFSSIKYDVFAEIMVDMSDDDLEKLLDIGQIKSSTFSGYEISDTLKHIATIYVLKACDIRREDQSDENFTLEDYISYDDPEIRALAFLQTVIEINKLPGKKGLVNITKDEEGYIFKVKLDGLLSLDLYSPKIKVSRRLSGITIDMWLDDVYLYNYDGMKHITNYSLLPIQRIKRLNSMILNIGNDAKDMEFYGYELVVMYGDCAVAYIGDLEFDDKELLQRLTEYNEKNQTDMSLDELKEHYLKYDDEYIEFAGGRF